MQEKYCAAPAGDKKYPTQGEYDTSGQMMAFKGKYKLIGVNKAIYGQNKGK